MAFTRTSLVSGQIVPGLRTSEILPVENVIKKKRLKEEEDCKKSLL